MPYFDDQTTVVDVPFPRRSIDRTTVPDIPGLSTPKEYLEILNKGEVSRDDILKQISNQYGISMMSAHKILEKAEDEEAMRLADTSEARSWKETEVRTVIPEILYDDEIPGNQSAANEFASMVYQASKKRMPYLAPILIGGAALAGGAYAYSQINKPQPQPQPQQPRV